MIPHCKNKKTINVLGEQCEKNLKKSGLIIKNKGFSKANYPKNCRKKGIYHRSTL